GPVVLAAPAGRAATVAMPWPWAWPAATAERAGPGVTRVLVARRALGAAAELRVRPARRAPAEQAVTAATAPPAWSARPARPAAPGAPRAMRGVGDRARRG